MPNQIIKSNTQNITKVINQVKVHLVIEHNNLTAAVVNTN